MALTLTPHQARTISLTCGRLTGLIESARTLHTTAKTLGMDTTARRLRSIVHTLDGARTRLVEDGTEYLPAADAFLTAGEEMLAAHATHIGRANNGRDLT